MSSGSPVPNASDSRTARAAARARAAALESDKQQAPVAAASVAPSGVKAPMTATGGAGAPAYRPSGGLFNSYIDASESDAAVGFLPPSGADASGPPEVLAPSGGRAEQESIVLTLDRLEAAVSREKDVLPGLKATALGRLEPVLLELGKQLAAHDAARGERVNPNFETAAAFAARVAGPKFVPVARVYDAEFHKELLQAAALEAATNEAAPLSRDPNMFGPNDVNAYQQQPKALVGCDVVFHTHDQATALRTASVIGTVTEATFVSAVGYSKGQWTLVFTAVGLDPASVPKIGASGASGYLRLNPVGQVGAKGAGTISVTFVGAAHLVSERVAIQAHSPAANALLLNAGGAGIAAANKMMALKTAHNGGGGQAACGSIAMAGALCAALGGQALPEARLLPVALALKRAAANFQLSPEQIYCAITKYAEAIPDAVPESVPGELTLAVVALTAVLSVAVHDLAGIPALATELRSRLGEVPFKALTSLALQAALKSPIGVALIDATAAMLDSSDKSGSALVDVVRALSKQHSELTAAVMMGDVSMQLIAALFERAGLVRVAKLSYAPRSTSARVSFYKVNLVPCALPIALVVHMGKVAHWEFLDSTAPGKAYHVPSIAEARLLRVLVNMQALNYRTFALVVAKPAPPRQAANNVKGVTFVAHQKPCSQCAKTFDVTNPGHAFCGPCWHLSQVAKEKTAKFRMNAHGEASPVKAAVLSEPAVVSQVLVTDDAVRQAKVAHLLRAVHKGMPRRMKAVKLALVAGVSLGHLWYAFMNPSICLYPKVSTCPDHDGCLLTHNPTKRHTPAPSGTATPVAQPLAPVLASVAPGLLTAPASRSVSPSALQQQVFMQQLISALQGGMQQMATPVLLPPSLPIAPPRQHAHASPAPPPPPMSPPAYIGPFVLPNGGLVDVRGHPWVGC